MSRISDRILGINSSPLDEAKSNGKITVKTWADKNLKGGTAVYAVFTGDNPGEAPYEEINNFSSTVKVPSKAVDELYWFFNSGGVDFEFNDEANKYEPYGNDDKLDLKLDRSVPIKSIGVGDVDLIRLGPAVSPEVARRLVLDIIIKQYNLYGVAATRSNVERLIMHDIHDDYDNVTFINTNLIQYFNGAVKELSSGGTGSNFKIDLSGDDLEFKSDADDDEVSDIEGADKRDDDGRAVVDHGNGVKEIT